MTSFLSFSHRFSFMHARTSIHGDSCEFLSHSACSVTHVHFCSSVRFCPFLPFIICHKSLPCTFPHILLYLTLLQPLFCLLIHSFASPKEGIRKEVGGEGIHWTNVIITDDDNGARKWPVHCKYGYIDIHTTGVKLFLVNLRKDRRILQGRTSRDEGCHLWGPRTAPPTRWMWK